MFAVSLKEVDFPVEKQNLYVRNNLGNGVRIGDNPELYIPVSSLSYVGECLINMDDHTVYQIDKHIRYTRTQDLIEQVLTEYGKFTPHIIYYSENKADVYINVYFEDRPNRLDGKYRLALEISNYYSARYSPKIYLSLYDIQEGLMVRTSMPAFNEKDEINLEGIQKIYDFINREELILVPSYVIKLLPLKYQSSSLIGFATPLNALNPFAIIVAKWLETNYELATMTQRKIYTILTNKGIKE